VETAPLRRDDPYAMSKVAAEECLRLFAKRLRVLSVRLFGLFGPGQQKMLPVVLKNRMQASEPITLEPSPGDTGEPEGMQISFTHIADVSRLLRQLAEKALAGQELPPSINLAADEAVSIRRFAETLGKVLGIEPRFVPAANPRACNLIADVGLLKSLVDVSFRPFEEAMRRSFAG
jgi:nucleoside-diphosphate-sugar epimerase